MRKPLVLVWIGPLLLAMGCGRTAGGGAGSPPAPLPKLLDVKTIAGMPTAAVNKVLGAPSKRVRDAEVNGKVFQAFYKAPKGIRGILVYFPAGDDFADDIELSFTASAMYTSAEVLTSLGLDGGSVTFEAGGLTNPALQSIYDEAKTLPKALTPVTRVIVWRQPDPPFSPPDSPWLTHKPPQVAKRWKYQVSLYCTKAPR